MKESVWYHGTDAVSALAFLNGMPLDAAKAAARKIDGPPAFYLARAIDDAAFFAARRGRGAVVEVRIGAYAYRRLLRAGMVRRPIHHGRYATFTDEELLIPTDRFAEFNRHRAAGRITFLPARWP